MLCHIVALMANVDAKDAPWTIYVKLFWGNMSIRVPPEEWRTSPDGDKLEIQRLRKRGGGIVFPLFSVISLLLVRGTSTLREPGSVGESN